MQVLREVIGCGPNDWLSIPVKDSNLLFATTSGVLPHGNEALGIWRSCCAANYHSLPSVAEVKNVWTCIVYPFALISWAYRHFYFYHTL